MEAGRLYKFVLASMLFPGGFKQTMRTLVLKRNRSTGIVLHLKRNGGSKS